MVSGIEASSHGKPKEWAGGRITREMQASRHWEIDRLEKYLSRLASTSCKPPL